MLEKKHQKHAKLTRPSIGFFSRNEWAIIGTPCGNIKQLAFALTQQLSTSYKVAYVDADHKNADEEGEEGKDQSSALAYGGALEYTDKITFHRFDVDQKLDTYQYRQLFNDQDVVLVNGNHFTAANQIVVVDPRKEKSLQKKLDRLTNVQLIVLENGVTEIPNYLKEHLEEISNIPVFKINEVDKIEAFLQIQLQATKAPLNGLVLAGGKSQRMGKDKGAINYKGKAHREYLADLLAMTCEETFMSCRTGQEIESNFSLLPDSFMNLGPFGAILSAFRQEPDSAWLTVACDLPLLDEQTIQHLIAKRNPSKVATAFYNPVTDFPEPLITIWEPKSYPILLSFLAQGYACPRKVLINSDIELVKLEDATVLKNVNKPEEYEAILKLMK